MDDATIAREAPVLAIVVPCFNEAEALPLTLPLLMAELDELVASAQIAPASKLVLVDDGSTDATWRVITEAAANDARIAGAQLARNSGFQAALMAGLMEARRFCDACVSIDADGQDDECAMGAMVDAYRSGVDVVYGVRSNRDADSVLKRLTAQGFYRFMAAMGAKTVYNHADYRLLSRRVLDELAHFPEANLYLRGLIPLVGFTSAEVYYARRPRVAGESHYSWSSMAALALDGITSLTAKPIHLIAIAGAVISLASVAVIIWALVSLLVGSTVPGWTSLICAICFIGGLQLFALGLIGEYVARIYMETKGRPRYIVARRVGSIPSQRERHEEQEGREGSAPDTLSS